LKITLHNKVIFILEFQEIPYLVLSIKKKFVAGSSYCATNEITVSFLRIERDFFCAWNLHLYIIYPSSTLSLFCVSN